MDLKKGKRVSNKILFIIPVLIVFLAGMFFSKTLFFKKKDNGVSVLNHKKVEKIYQSSDLESCTDLADTDEKVILFLIFGQMKKDSVLSDTIPLSVFESEAKKILNNDFNVHFSNYIFEGYVYNEDGDSIVRAKATCPSKSYVSKLYGYSINDNNIYLTIASGYVSDNVLYDLDGIKIAEYDKSEVNNLLDKGTMKQYKYTSVGGTYKFETIDE